MERELTAGGAAGLLADLQSMTGTIACGADDQAALPAAPGGYLLLIRLQSMLSLRIRTPASAVLPAGWYVYGGSAWGPGGIRARAGRHLWRGKRPHWHIDHLTEAAAATWAFAVPGGRECALIRALLTRPGYEAVLPGFGSSDCRSCASHLLAAHSGLPALGPAPTALAAGD
jgi:Uri superfamily endonuclease